MARSTAPRSSHPHHGSHPRRAGLIATLALLAAAPAAAFAAGTDAQREACTSDAFRLCTAAMPDEKQVESCLRAASPRLSRACYEVFYPQQASAPSEVTRGQASMRARPAPSAADRPQTPSMPQMPPGPANDDE